MLTTSCAHQKAPKILFGWLITCNPLLMELQFTLGRSTIFLEELSSFSLEELLELLWRSISPLLLINYIFQGFPRIRLLATIDATSPALDFTRKTVFHSAVALLRYIADCCRPDLHPVPSFLVSRVLSPTEEDFQKLVKCAKIFTQLCISP